MKKSKPRKVVPRELDVGPTISLPLELLLPGSGGRWTEIAEGEVRSMKVVKIDREKGEITLGEAEDDQA